MDCAGDWFCGGVCGGVWIGGVVYELGEAEGIYAICDLQDYFGGGGFVFCFADGVRRRGRVHTAGPEVGAPFDPGEARGAQKTRFAQGRRRARRRERRSTGWRGCCWRGGVGRWEPALPVVGFLGLEQRGRRTCAGWWVWYEFGGASEE